ncbi:Protein of unknown function DUF789 [Carpediemonas membranifera]|uniref:Intein C-terminal splicing domain-containing protein n=1 Tax=Carpediemonas membranifera TaxID=201153 RepID=A0A8J6B1D2_9EUKA|nr:Protein of unknown function DUF789 [Carpediemonas membranifera]|eukprot:KAG9390854.1 Protein of unknown function DUF789 [Carpediemonas membranifera]
MPSENAAGGRNGKNRRFDATQRHAESSSSAQDSSMANTNLAAFVQAITPAPITFKRVNAVTRKDEVVYSMSSLWKTYDCPYGFPILIQFGGSPVTVHYTPFLSAIELFPRLGEGNSPILQHASKLTPDIRPPFIDQIEALARTCPQLIEGISSDFDMERSWYSVSWYPILHDARTIPLVRGFILTYHRLPVSMPDNTVNPPCSWAPSYPRSHKGSPASSRAASPIPAGGHRRSASRSSSVLSEFGEPDLEPRHSVKFDGNRILSDADHTVIGFRCQSCAPSPFPTQTHKLALYHANLCTHYRYGVPAQRCNYPEPPAIIEEEVEAQVAQMEASDADTADELPFCEPPTPLPMPSGEFSAYSLLAPLGRDASIEDIIASPGWCDPTPVVAHPSQINDLLVRHQGDFDPTVWLLSEESDDDDDSPFISLPDGRKHLLLPPSVPYEKVQPDWRRKIDTLTPAAKTIVSGMRGKWKSKKAEERALVRQREKELMACVKDTLGDDRTAINGIKRAISNIGRLRSKSSSRDFPDSTSDFSMGDAGPASPAQPVYSQPSSPVESAPFDRRGHSDQEDYHPSDTSHTDDEVWYDRQPVLATEDTIDIWDMVSDITNERCGCRRNFIETIGLIPYKIRSDVWHAASRPELVCAVGGKGKPIPEAALTPDYVTYFLQHYMIDHPDLQHCVAAGSVVSVAGGLGYTVSELYNTLNRAAGSSERGGGQQHVVPTSIPVWTFSHSTAAPHRFAHYPAASVIRNVNTQAMKQVTLLDGTQVTCTADHRLHVIREGQTEPVWVMAGELNDSDRVVMGPKPITEHLPPLEHVLEPKTEGDLLLPRIGSVQLSLVLPLHLADIPRVSALARLSGYCMVAASTNEDGSIVCGESADVEALVSDIRCILRTPQLPVESQWNDASSAFTVKANDVLAELIRLCLPQEGQAAIPALWADAPPWVVREFLAGLWGAAGTIAGLVMPDRNCADAVCRLMSKVGVRAVLDTAGTIRPQEDASPFDTTLSFAYAARKNREQAIPLAWHRHCEYAGSDALDQAAFEARTTTVIGALAMPVATVTDVSAEQHPFSFDISVDTLDESRQNFAVDGALVHNCKKYGLVLPTIRPMSMGNYHWTKGDKSYIHPPAGKKSGTLRRAQGRKKQQSGIGSDNWRDRPTGGHQQRKG